MKEQIKQNIGDAEKLEALYQSDKKLFRVSFAELYPEIENHPAAAYWKARMGYSAIALQSKSFPLKELASVALICLLAGLLINLPGIAGFDADRNLFFARNALLIAFAMLVLYEIWIQRITGIGNQLLTAALFAGSALFINLVPPGTGSDTSVLSFLHLPLVLWCIYGFVHTGFDRRDLAKRFAFVKLNGDLAILGAIILIAGAALSGVTIALFTTLDMHIEQFYMEHIATAGLAAAPVVTAYILSKFPALTSKIAPIVAQIFSPLVSIVLLAYLAALAFSGADIFNNRDYLLIFNLILFGVMAIITFTISESSGEGAGRFAGISLFVLSCITLVVNTIALSGIVYRIALYGISPNKAAVAGFNILIFIHLGVITYRLFESLSKKSDYQPLKNSISRYLPVYFIWVTVVTFVFPFIFGR